MFAGTHAGCDRKSLSQFTSFTFLLHIFKELNSAVSVPFHVSIPEGLTGLGENLSSAGNFPRNYPNELQQEKLITIFIFFYILKMYRYISLLHLHRQLKYIFKKCFITSLKHTLTDVVEFTFFF